MRNRAAVDEAHGFGTGRPVPAATVDLATSTASIGFLEGAVLHSPAEGGSRAPTTASRELGPLLGTAVTGPDSGGDAGR
ncbi:hypothetical protein ABZ690_32615 [Streptomyces sp. NPDC006967]|uniref:hypothetical protein n=1 Tax=unclassified Streptomyces TaxID=2593676 RepID=UPI000CD5A809|nr:hypothetical protein [Streptomyces sp. SM1]